MDKVYGSRLNAPVMYVEHAKLRPFGEGGFKRFCPACIDGLLLVYRHEKTFRLLRRDRCLRCCQRVLYTDVECNGETFFVTEDAS